jgi:protein NrfD
MTPGAAAPYGRRCGSYAGQSYYGRPAIKPTHYGWLIAGYLFVGGIAGASQILAAVADLFGYRGVTRAGRYVALAGALMSPVLLIRDLHTPRRWYNMLRIFRPTSPMSIGSWVLTGFGTLSGLAALCQMLGARVMGRVFGLPAAAAGAVVSCYTGSLLSATSVPLWASAYRLLPPLFGASAMSTAVAATSLAVEDEDAHIALERMALAAGAAELALMVATERRWREAGVDAPVKEQPGMAAAYRWGVLGLGILLPLLIHAIHILTGRRSKPAATLANASALVGGLIQRALLTFAGNSSAERPEDYFSFTQRVA